MRVSQERSDPGDAEGKTGIGEESPASGGASARGQRV